MTPRDVDALADDEYAAMVRYMNKQAREMQREMRRSRRRR